MKTKTTLLPITLYWNGPRAVPARSGCDNAARIGTFGAACQSRALRPGTGRSPIHGRNARKGIRRNLFSALALALLVSCSRQNANAPGSDVDYYTCTMHPSVRKHDPKDKCPICRMDLVPVMKKGSASEEVTEAKGHDHARMTGEPATPKENGEDKTNEEPSVFKVPVQRQQQIGVTFATVQKTALRRTIRTVGVVTFDKQRHWDYVSRVEGYVQKLHVASRGERVEKDQPLLTLYSPELRTTQREFVDLLQMRDDARRSGSAERLDSVSRLLESAKRRLALWNITSNQIARLEQTRDAGDTLTLYSPFQGVIQDLPVDQGRRVSAGDHLVDVADLSVVWIWADFYQDDLPWLKSGLPVAVTTSSYPGQTFNGRIALVDPFLNDLKRTSRVRLDTENADFKLRPEMYVDVELELDMGEGLAVPVSAVLPTGRRDIVFVDKGEGRLEPRFVELGGKFGTNYWVKANLEEEDRVVNSANFLIDAEAKVQGALKGW